jgi:hypothetical protein
MLCARAGLEPSTYDRAFNAVEGAMVDQAFGSRKRIAVPVL